ncbi:zinc metalloproteinase nas-14-like isoform X2 [Agrilus planipennis]|nr:zinc metalloproteinase nas-14-like isoform X2 [Agrilus planipennis]XP_018332156.1 zinc metalloproteinase nas-14-like isoform X2 [Agrilus planipennis]XP_018332157.1 zinc metalloproteinase nas-14-like isoform X2 [Agrilus planipennis]
MRLAPEETKKLQDQDEEVKPGLFEGDIAMDEAMYDKWRVGFRWTNFPDKIWKNGIVSYYISELYNEASTQLIHGAIEKINYMTCVKLIPWDRQTVDYIHIQPVKDPSGCWSHVGRRGGEQVVSLQAPTDYSPGCLASEGTPIHEIMHALGTFHEQSRWDRDKYIDLHRDNIKPNSLQNFKIQPYHKAFTKYPYDYNSLMHYGNNFFAVDRSKPTITPKKEGVSVGQREGMSVLDCIKLNDLYGCFKGHKESYYRRICRTYGVK